MRDNQYKKIKQMGAPHLQMDYNHLPISALEEAMSLVDKMLKQLDHLFFQIVDSSCGGMILQLH